MVDARQCAHAVLAECFIRVCQKVKLGFLNVRSVRKGHLLHLTFTESISISTLGLTSTHHIMLRKIRC
jgi:hypothetical protein